MLAGVLLRLRVAVCYRLNGTLQGVPFPLVHSLQMLSLYQLKVLGCYPVARLRSHAFFHFVRIYSQV